MKGWRTVGDVTAGSVRRYIWTQQACPKNFSGGRKSERMKHGWGLAYRRIGFEHRCHVDMLKLCLLCSAQSLQIPSLQWRLEMPCKPWPPTALQLRLWLHFSPTALLFPKLLDILASWCRLRTGQDTLGHKQITRHASSKGRWNIVNTFCCGCYSYYYY